MAQFQKPLNITVLSGGPDAEAMISHKSAAAISEALRTAGHHVNEMDLPTDDPSSPLRDIPQDHVVFPALHGPWGEGGGAQSQLVELGLPFVGFCPDAARVAMDKNQTRVLAAQHGVTIAAGSVVHRGSPPPCPPPCILKPLDEGSSVGLELLHTDDELANAINHLTGPALCEAFVPGRECTVPWVLGQVLPVVEITPAAGLYDHEAKYLRDDTVFTVEPKIAPEVHTALEEATTRMAASLGARHLGRADFILGPDGPVFLEWNAMPGFTASSLLPRAAAHVGIPLPELTDRLVRAAHAEGPIMPIR
ncbi:MAG TPA: hypothetical protein DEQ73_01420 [Phycisphaerales bacterium]|jgi:D-alanine-D-alanine ligase|nr:MAG: hypothetical protein CBB84_005545 [Phycisphaera sp. TMED24]HCD29244.1 hypothetical protein [Phycisphaerales bacterium]